MKDNYDLSQLRKKPKRKNSRTKGNTFERQVATKLNERFKTKEICRSPGSGAFATTHSLPEHLKIYGDLITPLNFKFCIECKKGYNNINIYNLYNENSDIWKFFRQCKRDAKKCDKIPMLILKQDRQKILVVVPEQESFEDAYICIQIYGTRIYLFDDIIKSWDSYWFL